MENLHIYSAVRKVPQEAQKPISGGRLNGKTDINPMWRIKTLTEQFGPCGIGWKYTITDKKLERGANDEIAAFVDIDLYISHDGTWSEPIPGTGGSMFVTKEKNGPYTSDECFKMALTDAISVACKALGFGADVYWDKDKTKYTGRTEAPQKPPSVLSEADIKAAYAIAAKNGITPEQIQKKIKYSYKKNGIEELTKVQYDDLCKAMESVKKEDRP